jgi:purine-cytosine permease-like protein
MYLFGIEGAVLGPLLLCLLVVLSTITVNNLNTPTNSFTHQSSIDGSNSIATPAT